MLNLFILVTLQQFDEFNNKSENPIEKFQELSDKFKKSWNYFSDKEDQGYKIKKSKVSEFLKRFDWSQASYSREDKDEIRKYIMNLNLLT
jgi:hypothetical protein